MVLSFENHRELIVIPFAALTSFADPGVRFGLKFNILADEALLDEIDKEIDSNVIEPSKQKKPNNKEVQKKIDQSKNIVDLSKLRDKKNKNCF